MGLFRKRVNFFELLGKQCEIMRRGMLALLEYCEKGEEHYADSVITIEDEGDMARRVLIDELNRTFITPVERKDIFDLSRQIDEILDYAKTTVDEIRLFKVEANQHIISMVKILNDIAVHIEKAVANMEKHKNIARDEAIKVKSLENKVGATYYKAIAQLFDEEEDFHRVYKYRELYRHLNSTSDCADIAMDSLLDVLMSL